MPRAYLDHAATTPLDERVAATMVQALQRYPGNPSSLHREGREARRVLEDARERIAHHLDAEPRQVVFTGSATEAANTAILSLEAIPKDRRRILASPIEHPCVLEPLRGLAERGFQIDWMEVDSTGRLDVNDAVSRVSDDTAAVVAMLVNNETGVVQDTAPLFAAAQQCGAVSVCDFVQAPGKHRWSTDAIRASLGFLSPHKFGGPRGIGILIAREATALRPLVVGGGQERERRAGTENVVAALAAAHALDLALTETETRAAHRMRAEQRLLDGLGHQGVPYTLNGGGAKRVSGILNLQFAGQYGETLLMNLDLRGVAVSLGSACSSGSIEPSHVLRAMGLDLEANFSSLRVSLGESTRDEDVDLFVESIAEIILGSD